MTYAQLVNFTRLHHVQRDDQDAVDIPALAGPLAAVLVYSDPAGIVMPVAERPAALLHRRRRPAENVVMSANQDSVVNGEQLNVINP